MLSDADPNKQAVETLFSRKINSDNHSKLKFNIQQVQQCSLHKHIGLTLQIKLDSKKHLDEKIKIAIK